MSFESNSWYTLKAVAEGSSRSVQWCSQQIVCNSDTHVAGTNASWQLIAFDPMNPSKLTLRNLGKGPDSALAVFRNGNETQPGFAPLELHDPTQQWSIFNIEAINITAYSIGNVANGTTFALAERGNPLFMGAFAPNASFLVEGSGTSQKWVITKVGDIDDPAWSATPSASGTHTSTLPTSSSTPAQASSGSTTQVHHEDKHKLSAGSIAAIVVCIVAVLSGVALAWLLYRRKMRKDKARRHLEPTGHDTSVIVEKPANEHVENVGEQAPHVSRTISEMSGESIKKAELPA